MRLSPYVYLPGLTMALALAAAVWLGDGLAGSPWTGGTFPMVCGY